MNEDKIKLDDIVAKDIEKSKEITLRFYYKLVQKAIKQAISSPNEIIHINIAAEHNSLSKICRVKEISKNKNKSNLYALIDIEEFEELLKGNAYSTIFQEYVITEHKTSRFPYDKEYHINLVTSLEKINQAKTTLQEKEFNEYTENIQVSKQ